MTKLQDKANDAFYKWERDTNEQDLSDDDRRAMGQTRHGSNLETDVRTFSQRVDRADPLKNARCGD